MANPITLPKFKRIDALITHLLNSGETDDVKLHEALKYLSDSGLTLTQFLSNLQTSIGNGIVGKDGIAGKNGGSGPPGPAGPAGPPGSGGGVFVGSKGSWLGFCQGDSGALGTVSLCLGASGFPVLGSGFIQNLIASIPIILAEPNRIALVIRVSTNVTPLGLAIPQLAALGTYLNNSTAQRFFRGNGLDFVFSSAVASGNMGGVSIEFVGDTPLSYFISSGAGTVALSTTRYGVLNGAGGRIATEANTSFPIPFDGTLTKLSFTTASGQSATGTLVITVRINGIATALTKIISSTLGAGAFTIITNVAVLQGDLITLEIVNNATAASASLNALSIEIDSGSTNGLVGGNFAGGTTAAGLTDYYCLFGTVVTNARILTIPGLADVPSPRDGILKNFFLRVISGSNIDCTATIQINGIDSTLVITIPSGSGLATLNTTNTETISQGDVVRLKVVNPGSITVSFAGWGMEFD